MRVITSRYRVTLGMGNLLLAVILFFIGQFQLWAKLQRSHADSIDPAFIVAPAQRVSYCWNFPSLVLSGVVRVWTTAYIYESQRWAIQYSDAAYFLSVFGLWWWVGAMLDGRNANSESPLKPSLMSLIAYVALALLLMAVFGICVFEAIRNEAIVGRALPISGAVWSIALLLLYWSDFRRLPFTWGRSNRG